MFDAVHDSRQGWIEMYSGMSPFSHKCSSASSSCTTPVPHTLVFPWKEGDITTHIPLATFNSRQAATHLGGLKTVVTPTLALVLVARPTPPRVERIIFHSPAHLLCHHHKRIYLLHTIRLRDRYVSFPRVIPIKSGFWLAPDDVSLVDEEKVPPARVCVAFVVLVQ